MEWLKILGWLLIASPFVAIMIGGVKLLGWRETLAIFGTLALVVLVVFTGVTLAGLE